MSVYSKEEEAMLMGKIVFLLADELLKKEVEAAFSEYIYWQKEKLGRDINPNKLTQLLILAGAKRVEITSPIFQKIERDTVAKELTKSIKYIGEEDE